MSKCNISKHLDPIPIFVVSIQHFIFIEGLYINSTITLTRISVRLNDVPGRVRTQHFYSCDPG